MYVDDVGTAEFEENCKCECGIGGTVRHFFLQLGMLASVDGQPFLLETRKNQNTSGFI